MPDDTPNTPIVIDADNSTDPRLVYGFAESILVLDSYRGSASGTLKGAGLKVTMANDPDRWVTIVLTPEVMEKLRKDLDRVAKRQADEDYGRG